MSVFRDAMQIVCKLSSVWDVDALIHFIRNFTYTVRQDVTGENLMSVSEIWSWFLKKLKTQFEGIVWISWMRSYFLPWDCIKNASALLLVKKLFTKSAIVSTYLDFQSMNRKRSNRNICVFWDDLVFNDFAVEFLELSWNREEFEWM